MATWPSALPTFTVDSYGIDPQSQVARTDMDQGPARTRRRFTSAPTHYSVRWVMTKDEFAIFEAWYEYEVAAGAGSFAASLWNGQGFKSVECTFTEPWKATPVGPINFAVTGTLEVRDRPIYSKFDYLNALGLPSLEFDFAGTGTVNQVIRNPAQPTAAITFTRNSVATYFGADGLLKTAQPNVPRIDYDPVTLECRGLLIEESRTNLLTYSEQLWDTTKWSVGSTLSNFYTVTQSTDIPDIYGAAGSIAKFVAAVTTSSLFLRKSGLTLSSGTTYSPTIAVYVPTQTGVTSWTIFTDYQDVDTSSDATSTTFDRWVVVSIPPKVLTDSRNFVDFNIKVNGATPSTGFTFFAMAADLQAGAFHTSYIPTTSAAVTRAADVPVMTGTDFSSWYLQDEGSFVASYTLLGLASGGDSTVFAANNGTQNEQIDFRNLSTGVGGRVRVGGANQSSYAFAPHPAAGSLYVVANAYKTNDQNNAVNGVAGVTDTSGAVPSALTQLELGARTATNRLNGHLRRLAYYPKRLDNAKLQELTSA